MSDEYLEAMEAFEAANECQEDDGRYAFEMEQYEMMLDSLGTTDDRDEGFEEWCDSLEGRDDWMSQHEEMMDEDLDRMTPSELNDLTDALAVRAKATLAALIAAMAVGIG